MERHLGHIATKTMKTKRSLLVIGLLLTLGLITSHAQFIVPTTVQCATSIDGSVVGVPNPLNPPVLAAVYTGTLPAGTYYIQIAWYDANANATLPSPETSI